METFSAEKGLVVTKDREGEELVNGKWILFMPLWKWLLRGKNREH
jgi:predicted AAA+ superfamily ATPase